MASLETVNPDDRNPNDFRNHDEFYGLTMAQVLQVGYKQANEVLFNENDLVSSDPLDGIGKSGVFPVGMSDTPHLLYNEAMVAQAEQVTVSTSASAKVIELARRAA